MVENENKNKFDKEYFEKLNDEEREIYLYNIICYGIASELKIEEED